MPTTISVHGGVARALGPGAEMIFAGQKCTIVDVSPDRCKVTLEGYRDRPSGEETPLDRIRTIRNTRRA